MVSKLALVAVSLEKRAYTDSTDRISLTGELGGHAFGETKEVPGSRRKD